MLWSIAFSSFACGAHVLDAAKCAACDGPVVRDIGDSIPLTQALVSFAMKGEAPPSKPSFDSRSPLCGREDSPKFCPFVQYLLLICGVSRDDGLEASGEHAF